jgi:hypothetical protein
MGRVRRVVETSLQKESDLEERQQSTPFSWRPIYDDDTE